MTSFASGALALAIALVVTGAHLGAPAPETPPLPDEAVARVAQAVGEAWRVPAADVKLDWPHVSFIQLTSSPSVRLLGTGVNGWFAVRFDSTGLGSALVLRVRAGAPDTVTVATRPLASGTRLADGDVATAVRFRWGPPRASGLERPGLGWELRRALGQGDVVEAPNAAPPTVIHAGDPVRLVWNRGDVHVTVQGTALQSARRGGPVRVRMPGAHESITAVATGVGLAAVGEGGMR